MDDLNIKKGTLKNISKHIYQVLKIYEFFFYYYIVQKTGTLYNQWRT